MASPSQLASVWKDLNRLRVVIFPETLYVFSFISSSRNSAVGLVTGLQIGRLRNRGSVHGRARDFSRAPRLALGPTQPPIHSVPGFSGVIRPVREADNSPHLLLKNEWSYTSALPVCCHSVLTGITLPFDLYSFTHKKLLIFLQVFRFYVNYCML